MLTIIKTTGDPESREAVAAPSLSGESSVFTKPLGSGLPGVASTPLPRAPHRAPGGRCAEHPEPEPEPGRSLEAGAAGHSHRAGGQRRRTVCLPRFAYTACLDFSFPQWVQQCPEIHLQCNNFCLCSSSSWNCLLFVWQRRLFWGCVMIIIRGLI